MKKTTTTAYSEIFNNKILVPRSGQERLLAGAQLAEIVYILLYKEPDEESERPDNIFLKIYSAPPHIIDREAYGNGYYIADDWTGYIWHCENLPDVQRIVKDYEVFIREYIAEHTPHLIIFE